MGGVVAWSARHPAAGVRTCAAEVEAAYGCSILRPARNGTHEKKLFEREVAVKNISLGEAVGALEIERREHLPRENRFRNVGCVVANFSDDAIAEQLALFIPRSLPQLVGNVLDEGGHDVLAGGRERGIDVGRDDAIDPQLFGNFTEFCDVVAA